MDEIINIPSDQVLVIDLAVPVWSGSGLIWKSIASSKTSPLEVCVFRDLLEPAG